MHAKRHLDFQGCMDKQFAVRTKQAGKTYHTHKPQALVVQEGLKYTNTTITRTDTIMKGVGVSKETLKD